MDPSNVPAINGNPPANQSPSFAHPPAAHLAALSAVFSDFIDKRLAQRSTDQSTDDDDNADAPSGARLWRTDDLLNTLHKALETPPANPSSTSLNSSSGIYANVRLAVDIMHGSLNDRADAPAEPHTYVSFGLDEQTAGTTTVVCGTRQPGWQQSFECLSPVRQKAAFELRWWRLPDDRPDAEPSAADLLLGCASLPTDGALPARPLVDGAVDLFEPTLRCCIGQLTVRVRLLPDSAFTRQPADERLGNAIQRKFDELEGISRRLKARLGDVLLDSDSDADASSSSAADQPDDAERLLDEFENDLNTEPDESDGWPPTDQ